MTTIRRGTRTDIPALQRFFKVAYGAATVFQDADYLTWYLGGAESQLNSYIAVDDRGEIVSHYGWLDARLLHRGVAHPHIWGVNAFTLPELRGSGLGRDIVEHVRQVSGSFGVIGFSEKTADFYDSIGFNVLRKRRFERHVLVLRDETSEITRLIGTAERAALTSTRAPAAEAITTADAWSGEPVADLASFCTPERSPSWLAWRYSSRSLLDYRVLSHASELGRAVLAYRPIRLEPTDFKITRIVDLYGQPAAALALVRRLCADAEQAGHLYVELCSFGGPYAAQLHELGFTTLAGDDYSILPSLTNPIGHRENNEYVGLLADAWSGLTADDVYFTLADSDRDRRGRLPG